MLRRFRTALSLLTILPVAPEPAPTADDVAASGPAFPVVGLLLGALLGLFAAVAAWPDRPGLMAVVVLAIWLAMTGGLHFDGFADCCDGLLGTRSATDRLRIMKDPHLGSFALAGGGLLLLIKAAALTELLVRTGSQTGWVVLASVTVARTLVLTVAAGAHYPRPDGTGRGLIEATRAWQGVMAAVLAVSAALLAVPALGWWLALQGGLAALAISLAVRALAERRLGGVTGDVLGAAIELAEAALLLAAALG
jgi:adenosylcobinamide-GDP ribazoletransferase